MPVDSMWSQLQNNCYNETLNIKGYRVYCVKPNKGSRLEETSSGMQCSMKVTTSAPWCYCF